MKSTLIPALAVFAGGTLAGALGIWLLLNPAIAPTAADPVAEGDASLLARQAAAPVSASVGVAVAPTQPPDDPKLEPPPNNAGELTGAPGEWRALAAEVSQLRARLASVEQELARYDARKAAEDSDADRPEPPKNAEQRREALVSSGVDVGLAEDIVWRESQIELDRLTLRDLATREGWIGTDRYAEELNKIGADARSLRDEIGEASYDRFLYATGEDNRVEISSIIPGSSAEAAGFQEGDLVETYAGERLFRFVELRDRTTEGESGELVSVRLRRGSGVVDVWVPRGPLGVRLDMGRAEPLP